MKHKDKKVRLGRALATMIVAGLFTILAACGGSGNQSSQTGETQTNDESRQSEAGESSGNGGMDHSEMGGMDMASMLNEGGEYSDERFVDLMLPHHEGAVEMAEIALDGNAEHGEIEELSREIIRTQNAEIEELQSIRQEEFDTSEAASDVSEDDMAMMRMMDDPQTFAEADPFDLAFIEGMIPHHESAIDMAEVALDNSDSDRIRTLAQEIISAQERETSEMQSWREEWYPNS